jgi:hypothetical protein
MMTIRDISKLPPNEQAITRASYLYYRVLLRGAPDATCRRFRQRWLAELRRRWPDAWRNV